MLDKLKLYLESIKITPLSWLLGISGVLIVRFFLEAFSSPTTSKFFASDFSTIIHYYLFFLSFALVFVIFIQTFLPNFKKIAFQFVAASFAAIFIAPLIDWVVSGGAGFRMTYLFDAPQNMLASLLSFFGDNLYQGITVGIRIEALAILVAMGTLVYLETKNIFKTTLSVISLYTIIFIFVSMPGVVSFLLQPGKLAHLPITFFQNSILNSSTVLNNLPDYLKYGSTTVLFDIAFNFIMSKIFFLIATASALFLFYKNFKEEFKAIIGNSRPERVSHYIFMILLGMFASYSIYPNINLNWTDWLSIAVLCPSFYFSWMFAVCTNDVEDVSIDKITNQDRPLIKGVLGESYMKRASHIFLIASLIGGFLSGFASIFFLLAFTSLYYVYSAPPTKFKLIPFFSSFLIGLCCLAGVLAGFFIVSPVKDISIFPDKLAVAIVVFFFLWSHIRDMKDIEGDKKSGIPTVPVIFGDFWGPKVVGFLSSLAFLLVPLFVGYYALFISAIPAAIANYYFVNKKPYVESPIFKIYFAFVLASLILLAL